LPHGSVPVDRLLTDAPAFARIKQSSRAVGQFLPLGGNGLTRKSVRIRMAWGHGTELALFVTRNSFVVVLVSQ